MNEASQRQALLVESISTLETIKALQAESYLLRRWREHSKNAAKTSEQIKQLVGLGRQHDAVHPATGDGRAGRGRRLYLCGRRHHDRRHHRGRHAVGAGGGAAWADSHHAFAASAGDAVAENSQFDHVAARGPSQHGRFRQPADPQRRDRLQGCDVRLPGNRGEGAQRADLSRRRRRAGRHHRPHRIGQDHASAGCSAASICRLPANC